MRRTLLLLLLLAAAAAPAHGAPAASSSHALPPHVEGIVGPFYGGAVTTLGDLTNDGMSDYAVGAPMADGPVAGCGAVYVKYTTPFNNHPDTVLYGDQTNGYFGGSIAGVGDVNGDGYPDLLVGEDFATVGGKIGAGKAMLYLGSATGISTTPAWTFSTGESLAYVGYSVGRAGDLNGDGYDDWVVGATGHEVGGIATGAVYVFFGGSGSLPTAPTWTYVPTVRAGAGRSVAGAGDVNGDGYDDLIVGAPSWQNTQYSEGAALLFLGHAGLPSATPDKAWFGGQGNALFGTSVAAAGDVNGDGYADVIVGAPGMADPAPSSGEAFVFHGGPFPPLYSAVDSMSTHQANNDFGLSVATAGDINGDGYADVIVGVPYAPQTFNNGFAAAYFGTPTGVYTRFPAYFIGTSTPGELVGYSVSTLGDINDDGLSEAVAGCPSTTGGGETGVLFVQPEYRNAIERLAGQGYAAGARFGQTAITADVNGDGYDDLVTGTTVGEPVTGSLALYYGGPHPFPPLGGPPDTAAAPAWTYPSPGDGVGYALANAGDVNGDGYEDFISGAPHHDPPLSSDVGMAILFYGSSAGPSPTPWQVVGDSASAQFGSSVGGGGDLNGDGYDDVAVGEVHGARVVPDEGVVKVYLGSSFGLAHVPAKVLAGGEAGSQFGAACAIVGDVNGDGYDDLVVGAPHATSSAIEVGKAYVYFGSKTGLPTTPSQTLVGDAASLFGSAVARVGDVNGDGYADVAVGAPGASVNAPADGRISVFYGSATGLVQPAGFTLAGSAAGVELGEPGEFGAAGDVNRDGWDDMIVGNPLDNGGSGSIRIFEGNYNGLLSYVFLGATTPQAGAGLGTAVGGAADFDGDGIADYFYSAPGLDTGFGAQRGRHLRAPRQLARHLPRCHVPPHHGVAGRGHRADRARPQVGRADLVPPARPRPLPRRAHAARARVAGGACDGGPSWPQRGALGLRADRARDAAVRQLGRVRRFGARADGREGVSLARPLPLAVSLVPEHAVAGPAAARTERDAAVHRRRRRAPWTCPPVRSRPARWRSRRPRRTRASGRPRASPSRCPRRARRGLRSTTCVARSCARCSTARRARAGRA